MANINNVRGEKFIFTIANASGSTKVIALLAAFFDTLKLTSTYVDGTHADTQVLAYSNPAQIVAAGYACDAVADDGTIATSVTCTASNSKKTVRAFREYLKLNSRALRGMSIQTNLLASWNQTLEVIQATPLEGSKSTYIPLTALRDGLSNLNDVVSLDGEGLVLGEDTLMLCPILDGASLTFSFWF